MSNKIIIVDVNNNPVGLKTRDEFDRSTDYYRCTGIWITNSKGEILIAQRKFTKKHDPGKWGPGVAGTVEEGETYESNAYKELEEELGIVGVKLRLGPLVNSLPKRRFFGQWYFCTIDKSAKDFRLQENEVEKVMWISRDDLIKDIEINPDKYVSSLPDALLELSIK